MVGYVLVWALHISNPFLVLAIISVFYQLARGILEFTPWNVFPFVPDIDHMMTRGDRAGIYAAVMTFFRKSTGAVASWIAGILLAEIGFNSKTMLDAITTPSTIQTGIAIIFLCRTCCFDCTGIDFIPEFQIEPADSRNLEERNFPLGTGRF